MVTVREKQIAFNEALAIAITQWQLVELELYRIFLWCVNPAVDAVASASFHAVINFNTRMAMTDAAAHIALRDDPAFDTWCNLRNRAKKRSKRRNELVHFMTLHVALDDGDMRFRLVPSMFDVNAADTKEYDTNQIKTFSRQFGRLSQDMHEFANSLFGQRASLR